MAQQSKARRASCSNGLNCIPHRRARLCITSINHRSSACCPAPSGKLLYRAATLPVLPVLICCREESGALPSHRCAELPSPNGNKLLGRLLTTLLFANGCCSVLLKSVVALALPCASAPDASYCVEQAQTDLPSLSVSNIDCCCCLRPRILPAQHSTERYVDFAARRRPASNLHLGTTLFFSICCSPASAVDISWPGCWPPPRCWTRHLCGSDSCSDPATKSAIRRRPAAGWRREDERRVRTPTSQLPT